MCCSNSIWSFYWWDDLHVSGYRSTVPCKFRVEYITSWLKHTWITINVYSIQSRILFAKSRERVPWPLFVHATGSCTTLFCFLRIMSDFYSAQFWIGSDNWKPSFVSRSHLPRWGWRHLLSRPMLTKPFVFSKCRHLTQQRQAVLPVCSKFCCILIYPVNDWILLSAESYLLVQ